MHETTEARTTEARTNEANAAILAAVERLHARLDTLERRLAPLDTLVVQAPAALAMWTDTVDSLAARLEDVDGRLTAVSRVTERLTRPESLSLVEALLDRTERLREGLALLDQLPGVLAMATDTFDDLAARVAATGTPVHARAEVLLGAAERLTSPAALEVLKVVTERLSEVKALLESGVLDPEAVRVVSLAGRALVASRACECGPLGPIGALRALSEPEVQRTLGFAVAFARQFGVALDAPTAPTAPIAPTTF